MDSTSLIELNNYISDIQELTEREQAIEEEIEKLEQESKTIDSRIIEIKTIIISMINSL